MTIRFPNVLYQGKRLSVCGHQAVYCRALPDGEWKQLSPEPSQRLHNHSPNGFQWGYGGSGPAQLALALLLDATGNPNIALAHYQDFKWEFVAGWGEEWETTRDKITAWIHSEEAAGEH